VKYKIVFLRSAEDDLLEIRRDIRRHFSQRTWLNAYAKIRRALENLEAFPLSGHAPPELPATHFLEILAANNRVIYEVIGTTVYVHILCDARQDFTTKLSRRPIRSFRK